MLAVATSDVIAVDPPGRTFLLVGYIGSVRSELVEPHIAGLVDDLSAGCVACRIEVFGDRRLPIGHHLLAGEFFGVNEETRSALPGDGRAVMGMPLAIHSLAQSYLPQQRDGAGLQHPGTNSLQHMAAALSFQENAVDAVAVKNMGQEQTGRAAADDRYLGLPRRRCHCRLSKKDAGLAKAQQPKFASQSCKRGSENMLRPFRVSRAGSRRSRSGWHVRFTPIASELW